MKRPTDKQIVAQIAALRKVKPGVREHNAFGDNHYHAIEAQLDVLEGKITLEEVEEAFDWAKENVRDAAVQAACWLNGSGNCRSLAADWRLVK